MADPQEMQDQWLDITDFSPGCYSHTNTTGVTDRLLEAPVGAADPTSTWSCLSLPDGGLGALPMLSQNYGWTASENATGPNYLVGMLVHDGLANGQTEAFVICEFDNGTNHSWSAYSYIIETTTFSAIVDTLNATGAGVYGSPYPTFTRAYVKALAGVTFTNATNTVTVSSGGFPGFSIGAEVTILTTTTGSATVPIGTIITNIVGNTMTLSNNVTVTSGPVSGTIGSPGLAGSSPSATETPGQPVIVFPNGGPATATDVSSGQVYMYPNPATPSTYSALPLIQGSGTTWSSTAGPVVCYDNRVLCLTAVNYPYPAGGGFDGDGGIDYTDPPNSVLYGAQQTVLTAEWPFGWGCALSVSAGELFLVRNRGGGVLVTGDIFSPNVTSLDGVQPTGDFFGRADSGTAGGFYCSLANGAWTWNGGSTSQKISTNLDDDFFLSTSYSTMGSGNYGFFVQCIGDKTYFSQNWMFDTRTGGWWKYYPDASQGGIDLWWVNPVAGRYIYAAPLEFSAHGTFLCQFDTSTPEQSYQWTSLPLLLSTKDRVSDVREVVVRASSTGLNGQVTLTIFDKGNEVWGPTTQTGNVSNGPDYIRFNTAGLGVTEPQFRISVANTGGTEDMPVIHGISARYRPRAHQGVTD